MALKSATYSVNASLMRRFVAFIIDIAILNILVLGPFRGLFRSTLPSMDFRVLYDSIQQSEIYFNTVYASSIAIGFIIFLYFTIMEYKIGQTIGKMILGIYVINYQPTEIAEKVRPHRQADDNISAWQAIVRNLCFITFFPFFLFLIIDPIYMVFNRQNQRLSEKISKTKVVEKHSMDR